MTGGPIGFRGEENLTLRLYVRTRARSDER